MSGEQVRAKQEFFKCLNRDLKKTIRILLLILPVYKAKDCEQFLFSSKIHGEERKTECNTSEQLWACKRDLPSRERQVGRASPLSRHALTSSFHAACLRFSPRIFEEKRDRSQSNKAKTGASRTGVGRGGLSYTRIELFVTSWSTILK